SVATVGRFLRDQMRRQIVIEKVGGKRRHECCRADWIFRSDDDPGGGPSFEACSTGWGEFLPLFLQPT
ncbi:MAG: hypothetical protein KGJ37_02310, partial [Verrucomicrobiota bacterium]|nr:hypothetical protein [Verrucomicrobiota bacterium]